MSTIVLVHGIAQEQDAADVLEAQWLPALAGGVRTSGHPGLADRLWRRDLPGEISTRMAFYGDRFLEEGAQGAGDISTLDQIGQGLAERLAVVWLGAAADRASDDRDRREASRLLNAFETGDLGAQGPKAALRPAVNALMRIRWFAPFGMGLARRFICQALTQVTRYLSDESIRSYAQDQVLAHVGPETRLVIGHSLGSVVAYEALHRTDQPVALLTLGSPLGLQNVIYQRLRPQPPHVPLSVNRWDNLVDLDDLVATRLDLATYFPPAPTSTVVPETALALDNGAKPHDVCHYLTKNTTGRIIADVLR